MLFILNRNRRIVAYCVLILCVFSCKKDRKNDEQTEASNDTLRDVKPGSIHRESSPYPPFKYGPIESFTPGMLKDDSLPMVDSVFHKKFISQILGHELLYSESKNHFVSRQNKIRDLNLVTISLYWDLCYEAIVLLITKEDKLTSYIPLTEWHSSCGSYSKTETTFLSDSVFKQSITITNPGGDYDDVREFEFKALIDANGKIDTLEILVDKEYQHKN